jgi:SMC interacting uncharacterized protein involved in chromosome segregation
VSDLVLVALISSATTIVGSIFSILFIQSRQARNDAKRAAAEVVKAESEAEKNRKATDAERERLEREITERVLASSNAELERQQKRIDSQQQQIDRMQTKLIDKDVEMAAMRRGFQEQIDKLAEMVRQLLKQLQENGHRPVIDMDEFKAIEAKYH